MTPPRARPAQSHIYRASHLVADYLTNSALANGKRAGVAGRAGSWARWWNTQIKVNLTKVYDQTGRPVML